ncbi:hypothetical protein MMC29_005699 [Sticta canariensis]|nr:hypothetical protein [Sticta canariensis]
MVKLSSAVPMGQTSSKADAFEPEELGANSAKRKGRKDRKDGKKKPKRRGKSSKESADLDEQSARVLLQLREDAGNRARMMPPDEMFAASAQLWAESPPASPPTSNAIKIEMAELSRITSYPQQDEQRRKKKKKKRNRHEFEASQHEADNSEVVKEYNTERPSKQARSRNSISKPKDPLSLTQSTFSLDDISTDDETIAAYLQEYEKNFASPKSPKSTHLTQIGAVDSSESRMKQPAVIHYQEGSNSLVQPVYQLPWRSDTSPSRPEKEKSKRKTRSDRVSETSNGVQEQVDGPGPHAFAIDHEAFDEEFETQQYDSEDPAEYDPPIDSELIQDRSIQAPTEDAIERPDKDIGPQPSNEAKLKRVLSPSRKRKEVKKPCRVNPSDLPYTRPEDLIGSQQDAVLPEIEDSLCELQQDSSAELECSAPPTTSRHREKTLSPIAKAYNARGNRSQESGKRGKHYDPPLQQIAQNGGIFIESEILKLDAFRDSYCRQNDLTQWQFNALVQSQIRGNPDAADLWDEAHQITPYRTRTSTMRFCRRRYHNFSVRGSWTQSEDEGLRQAVAEKGKSWKAVGEMIERFPEDCRDRYRNYHVNSEHRNRAEWTEGEVRNLCNAVYVCMQMMKEERQRAREEIYDGREVPESEPEVDQEVREMKLINWQAVSDRMGPAGGGRSRLQCSFKWGKLKMADRNRYLKEVKAAKRAKLPTLKSKSRQAKRPWRIRRALKKLRNMKLGDRYDFLEALSTCGAVEEENIPYRLLGDETFRSRWTTVERKAAWQKFKDEVPGAAKMEYREVVNRLLTRLMAENGDRLEERWDPEKDGDVNLAKNGRLLTENEKKERAKLRQEARERKFGIKSAEFVHSTDEDEDPVKSTNNPAGVVVKEKDCAEKQSVAGSSAAAADDADENASGGNAGPETHGSGGSEVEDFDDDSLFASSSPPRM